MITVEKTSTHKASYWVNGAFIRGPLPLVWLQKAASCGSNALEAALMLWYKRGLCRNKRVKVGNAEATLSGKSPETGRRALLRLEEAGLITIELFPGRKKFVTIID